MSQIYNLTLPTSIETADGWQQQTNAVFILNPVGQQIRPKSIRLNGILELQNNTDLTAVRALNASDKVSLSNAGAHGFIRQINTKMNGSIIETFVDYGKFKSLRNEATNYQIDQATTTSHMLSLVSYSNDADKTGLDVKNLQSLGALYPPIPVDNTWTQLPFSIVLDICLNNSNYPLPSSKTGEIEINVFFQDVFKCGIVSQNVGQNFDYRIKNLEMRYLTDPEVENPATITMEVKSQAHIGTLVNQTSNIEFNLSAPADSIVAGFLKSGQDSTTNDFQYNYCGSTSISNGEKLNYLQLKVNGQDDVLQYILQFQQVEIQYNYLLAHHPLIFGTEKMSVSRNGMSYTKLGENDQGYGVGCQFIGGLESGTRVSFLMQLASVPTSAYRAYFFSIGKLFL
jgi:hypothetical protein